MRTCKICSHDIHTHQQAEATSSRAGWQFFHLICLNTLVLQGNHAMRDYLKAIGKRPTAQRRLK